MMPETWSLIFPQLLRKEAAPFEGRDRDWDTILVAVVGKITAN